jgi:hypothetical protein
LSTLEGDEEITGDNEITARDILDELDIDTAQASDWLEFEGTQVHMSSSIRCLFTSDLAQKSCE